MVISGLLSKIYLRQKANFFSLSTFSSRVFPLFPFAAARAALSRFPVC
jgi:hypothetical protein